MLRKVTTTLLNGLSEISNIEKDVLKALIMKLFGQYPTAYHTPSI